MNRVKVFQKPDTNHAKSPDSDWIRTGDTVFFTHPPSNHSYLEVRGLRAGLNPGPDPEAGYGGHGRGKDGGSGRGGPRPLTQEEDRARHRRQAPAQHKRFAQVGSGSCAVFLEHKVQF